MKKLHEPCEKTKETLFKIGAFAQINRVTVKTLRFYEEEGLLKPAYIDEMNGYRYYTLGQMAELHRISALKEAGFTLQDIKLLNEGYDKKELITKKRAEILNKIAELTKMLAVIDGDLVSFDTIDQPVLVKKIDKALVAKVTTRIKGYEDLFEIMPKLGYEMENLGLECAIPDYCFTEYLEAGYLEENILVSCCQAITKKGLESQNIIYDEALEILAACIYHKGGYDKLPNTYASIINYINNNGYEIAGNIREVYIDGIWNKDNEADWLTEIQIPIRRIK